MRITVSRFVVTEGGHGSGFPPGHGELGYLCLKESRGARPQLTLSGGSGVLPGGDTASAGCAQK